ncbi:MAG TPA: DUF493 family protein [Candidatus Eremiobacteraeota bacterium]|nr:MAG: hypothetical protein BWY64_03803 [bacterium ADurb.Bin363]HPZ08384.1 DUF493 family protein [Candidatus Eremiobacteraeota bacterium]
MLDNFPEKREIMEGLITFPGDYVFKIIGQNDKLDIEKIRKEIEIIVRTDLSGNIKKKESSKKKYSSYSISVYLEDYEQLKNIYKLLKSQESVIYYL